MYKLILSDEVENLLAGLSKAKGAKAKMVRMIVDKFEWLSENVDRIKREKLKGSLDKYSLHCGQYRFIYQVDKSAKVIYMDTGGKHDEAYRRAKRKGK